MCALLTYTNYQYSLCFSGRRRSAIEGQTRRSLIESNQQSATSTS